MENLGKVLALLASIAITSTRIVRTPKINREGHFELKILHNNDMHARFEQTSQRGGTCNEAAAAYRKCYGGFARVSYLVRQARQDAASGDGPPVLFLNAGNTYTGTAWFTLYKWEIALAFLNALQPDAMCLGNREFDYGVTGLVPFIEKVNFPVLAANLDLAKEPRLRKQRNLMHSVVFDMENTKVGVIGYVTPNTKFLVTENNVEFKEEIGVIREEVKKLKRKGINILIALGHSGYNKDLEIAEKVEDIDLVIGGHTDTFLWNGKIPDIENPEGPYPTIVKQTSGRQVPVVQAYANTKYLGNLHLIFDSDGELVNYHGDPILLNASVPQDPELLKLEKKYRAKVKLISDVVVGNSSVILDGHTCRLQECNLGNLVTDAMIRHNFVEYNGDGWTDAPIAVVTSGVIRSSVAHPKRPMKITLGDLLTVLPLANSLIKIEISGAAVLEMLEHSVKNYDLIDKAEAFLQMSGIYVEYDLMHQPGKRVVKALARCGKCDIPVYLPVNRSETYSILTILHLYTGGDGYTVFKDLPLSLLDRELLQVTAEFIKTLSPVHPAVEGRIVLHNDDKIDSVSSSTSLQSPKINLTNKAKITLDIIF